MGPLIAILAAFHHDERELRKKVEIHCRYGRIQEAPGQDLFRLKRKVLQLFIDRKRGWNAEDQVFPAQLRHIEDRGIRLFHIDAKDQPSVPETGLHGRKTAFRESDPAAGAFLPKAVDDLCQHIGTEIGRASYADGSLQHTGDRGKVFVDLIVQRINLTRFLQPELSLRRQPHRRSAAVKERDVVKLFLKLLYGGAQRRLGNIQTLGCPGEASFLADGQDIFVVTAFHEIILRKCSDRKTGGDVLLQHKKVCLQHLVMIL